MRRTLKLAFIVSTLVGIALPHAACSQERPDSVAMQGAAVSHGAQAVEWETEWARAFERARTEGKVVVADFYADWCVWCKHMDGTTFQDAKVTELMAERVVPLKLDTDRGGRDLAVELRVQNLPTIVIFDVDGDELGRIPGYASPASFVASLNEFLSREG